MAIHYKFKSAKDYESVPIDGDCVSLSELKGRIVEKMKLRRAPDFDLVISDSQTGEEYVEGSTIPRNSSLLLRRVPGTIRMPTLTFTPPKPPEVPVVVPAVAFNDVKSMSNDWSDDFGVDLYEDPQLPRAQTSSQAVAPAAVVDTAKDDEEARIKAFCDASASDWERQTQQSFGGGRGHGRGAGGQGRGGFVRRVPPEGYVCHRCNEPGHFIQHCPTNKDPAYNIKRVRLPTGIPRTMLVANPSGSYALPNGEIATLKPNEELFEKEVNALLLNKPVPVSEVPAELRCPLCKDVLKDAVLTSKCCFKSFCDHCIRNEIIARGRCVCGASNVLADTLLPNRTLRDAIQRLLESNAATSSENLAVNRSSIPDMESALPLKAASPSSSVSVKDPVVKPSPDAGAPVQNQNAGERVEDGAEGVEVNSATTSEPCFQENNSENDEQMQKKINNNIIDNNNKPKRRPPKQMIPGAPAGQMLDAPMMQGFSPQFWPMHMNMPMGDGYMMPYAPPYPYPMMPDPYSYPGMVPPPYPQSSRYPANARRKPDERERSSSGHKDYKRRREDSDGYRRSSSSSYDYKEHSSSHRDREESHSSHSSRSSRHRERDHDEDHRRDYEYEDHHRDDRRREYEDDRRREYEDDRKSRRLSVFLRVKNEDKPRCT